MPAMKQIWDRDANGGNGGFVSMFSLNATDAVKHDAKRYSFEKPEGGSEPRPAPPPEPEPVAFTESIPQPASTFVAEPEPAPPRKKK